MHFEKNLLSILEKSLEGFETLVSTSRLTSGASRITYEITTICKGKQKKVALRINPRDSNKDGLMSQRIAPSSEAKVMELARSAGVPTPEIIYIFDRSDNLGEGYLMTWMDGESLGSKIARGQELQSVRPILAKQCGQILARLHSIDISGLDHSLDKVEPMDYVSQQYKIYQSLGVQRPMIDYVARWLKENPPRERPLCLVHNDFRNGNLLVDKINGISGVLDWEIAHIGNPVRDIGWLCTASWRFGVPENTVGGFGILDDLLNSYKESGGVDLDKSEIKFWTVFGSFWWAIACLLMEKSYENGEDQSIERPIIGRRVSECEIDCANLLMPGKTSFDSTKLRIYKGNQKEPLLLAAVKEFIKEEMLQKTKGRPRFLATIAFNAIDITIREYKHGPEFRAFEQRQLEELLKREENFPNLRLELSSAIKNKIISLDNEELKRYLRDSALLQILIDLPNYPGLDALTKTIS